MAFVGMNVARDGSIPVDWIKQTGSTWIRIVATPENDLTNYFMKIREAGIRILLVLARESGDDYAGLAARYAMLVDAVQVGNEPDLESHSSWTMSAEQLAFRGYAARSAFRGTPIVCGGLASGQPDYLEGVDLGWCDVLAIHPYLKDAPNPGDIEDLPDVHEFLAQYARYGKPMMVTEWGWWGDEENRAAEEVRDMVSWAAQTDQIIGFFYFCASDSMVPPFGLVKTNGNRKKRYHEFVKEAEKQAVPDWPVFVPPGPTIPRDNPWEFFSAEQIARITGCPIQAVRENWPKLVNQLVLCEENDRPTQIAMIATIAIETARTFKPVREAYYLGEPEPAETWRRNNLRYYPYYGRGYIQLTWRENYAAYGPNIARLWGAGGWEPDFDLVNNPDNALNGYISAAVSALYFRDHGGEKAYLIPKAAARRDWREVRRLVQGGDAGLTEFTQMAEALWKLDEPVTPPVPVDPTEGYKTAIRHLADVVVPKAAAGSKMADEAMAEAQRIKTQFLGDEA